MHSTSKERSYLQYENHDIRNLIDFVHFDILNGWADISFLFYHWQSPGEMNRCVTALCKCQKPFNWTPIARKAKFCSVVFQTEYWYGIIFRIYHHFSLKSLMSFSLSINSLWSGDAISRHRTWSTLVQIIACCLTAPSYYLGQYWLTTNVKAFIRGSFQRKCSRYFV